MPVAWPNASFIHLNGYLAHCPPEFEGHEYDRISPLIANRPNWLPSDQIAAGAIAAWLESSEVLEMGIRS
jgi:hypothetical protein